MQTLCRIFLPDGKTSVWAYDRDGKAYPIRGPEDIIPLPQDLAKAVIREMASK